MITLSEKLLPRMLLADQALGLGLGDGRLEPLDGQGILGADVDVGLRGPDGVGGDGHAFQQAMRIALDHGPIHERPGIAFVGVADQVLLLAAGVAGELPLRAGGKTSAAPAAQSAGLDHLADLLRRLFLQGLP